MFFLIHSINLFFKRLDGDIMIINIQDYTDDKFNMGIEQEVLDLSPWVILNMNEIGDLIACNLFDVEYDIKQEYIDEDINDFFSYLHQYIFDRVVDKLKENNREVI